MYVAEEYVISRLARVTTSIGTATQIPLYTVPTGYKAIFTKVIFHSVSGDCSALVGSLGASGDGTAYEGWSGDDLTFTKLAATGSACVAYPGVLAETVDCEEFLEYAAGTIFAFDIATIDAGQSLTIDVFGYLVAV
jgi:hypothetical protein